MAIKILFLTIWISFILRIGTYIKLDKNIFQFDLKNWFIFFQDILSIIILIGLSIYLFYKATHKKIHVSIILIIYPICGLLGYFVNGTKNAHQDFILWHHFITLSSVLLFFAAIQSNKVFDYKFKELLLKIILTIIFAFFLIIILPDIMAKIFSKIYIRSSYDSTISILGAELNIKQNVNGSSRVMVILLLIFLMLFKKFILKKIILAYTFFLISLLLFTAIYLLQSRFNILASFLIIFFLFLSIKNINLKNKLIYFVIFFTVPLFISNIIQIDKRTLNSESFENDYNLSQFKNNICERSIFLNLEEKNPDFEELNFFFNKICINGEIKKFDELLQFTKVRKNFNDKKQNFFTDDEKDLAIHLESLERSLGYNMRNICSPKLKYLDILSSGRICGWEILLNNIRENDLLFGRGFFADQFYLKYSEKLSSNSWINILYNAGIISLFLCLTFLIFSLLKFYKKKNINHTNFFISISHYLLIYFILRSLVEDTLAFVSIDFLLSFVCLIIIKENVEKKPSQ